MTRELPHETYTRLTGRAWADKEARAQLMQSLGITAPAGSAEGNLALQVALLRQATTFEGPQLPMGPQLPPPSPPVAGRGAGGYSPEHRGSFLSGAADLIEAGARKMGIPAHTRIAVGSLLGRTSPITNEDVPDTLDDLRFAVANAKQAGRNYITYEDYPSLTPFGGNPFKRMTDPSHAASSTVGLSDFTSDEEGDRLQNIYDFLNPAREASVKRYEAAKQEGTVALIKEFIKQLDEERDRKGLAHSFGRIPDHLMNAGVGRQGRQIDITLPAAQRTRDIVLTQTAKKKAPIRTTNNNNND